MKRLLLLTTAAVALTAPLSAQNGDAPPVDASALLEKLKGLRDQNESGMKSRRMTAYQTVSTNAATAEKAVAYWKEAVKAVQFDGAEKEGAQIRDWREGEGEALNDRLCSGAVRLHLQWLALSLQHSAGAEMKILLPKVLDHIAAVQADEVAADHLQDQLEKAKDRGATSPGARKNLKEDSTVRKVHDQIMKSPVTHGPVGKWMRVSELLDAGPAKPKGRDRDRERDRDKETPAAAGWELSPGNIDGIYATIVLPEYRANRDARLLDYWDMMLKRESDRVADKKLDVEQRDWTQVKKPKMQWSRSQDVLLLGYKNKAILEMFNLVKSFPNHPDAAGWIGQLETILAPPPAFSAADTLPPPAPSTPAPNAALPRVAPPVTIPAATPTPGSAPVRPTPATVPTRPTTGLVPAR